MPNVEPTRLRYGRVAELPPVDEIVRLAEATEWLQIEVAVYGTLVEGKRNYDPEHDKRMQIAQELIARLPDYAVWGGEGVRYENGSHLTENQDGFVKGTAELNIERTAIRQVVTERLDKFLIAALRYEELVNPVMERMAIQFGLPLTDFSASRSWPDYFKRKSSGIIAARPGQPETDAWSYFFHGGDCNLGNSALGRCRLEARLGFGADCGTNFGVLDSSFFSEFIGGNASFAQVAKKPFRWQEMQQALQTIERRGFLRSVQSERSRSSDGWVLTDAGRQRANEARAESKTADA